MNRHLLCWALLLVLPAGLLGPGPAPVRADAFVVSVNLDDSAAHDWLPGDGMCADSYGYCTLRAAIEETNAYAGADTITFANSMYIQLDTLVGPLPNIVGQLRIDASGVWNGADNQPGVTINGGNQSFAGFILAANNCEVYGLFLINFGDGVNVASAYNTIGAPTTGYNNIISSNLGYGVAIHGPAAHHNVVSGNIIGLSITGDSKAPNLGGVSIADGAYQNTIGGDSLGKGNVISGNTYHGVVIHGTNTDGNRLGANFIGPAAVGDPEGVGNGGIGVYVYNGARDTHIGSTGSGLAGNFIEFNGGAGVSIWGAHANWIEANSVSGNGQDGVVVWDAAGNGILANEIAYNGADGVYVTGATATGNPILGNSIYHNGQSGIDLFDGGNAMLAAPVIATAHAGGATGTGCAGCNIHLFADSADEGQTYQGFAYADAGGHWSYSGPLSGPFVTATNTNSGSNTSEFSAPFAIGGQRRVMLPFVMRRH